MPRRQTDQDGLLLVGKNDPVLHLLRYLRFRPITIFVAILLVITVREIVFVLVFDNPPYLDKIVELFHLNYIATWVVGSPATWAAYIWVPIAISTLVRKLTKEEIFVGIVDKEIATEREVEKALLSHTQQLQHILNWWPSLILVIAIVLTLQFGLLIPEHSEFLIGIRGRNLTALIISEAIDAIGYYMAFVTIYRLLIFTWWILRVFRLFEVKVTFLHPDLCGGLGKVGEYVTKTGLVIGAWGFMILAIITTNNFLETGQMGRLYFGPVVVIAIAAFAVGAPFAFFTPVWTAHLAMKRTRDKKVQEIAIEFDSLLLNIDGQSLTKPSITSENIEQLEHLEKLSQLLRRAPVWPFNIHNVIGYFTRTYIPMIVSVFLAILEFVA